MSADELLFFANVPDEARFREAIRRFDQLNSADPNRERLGDREEPRELVYAQRLSRWIMRLDPNASEELRLAARSQHLCRWMIPRDSYSLTRAGYHQWRTQLKKFHAAKSAEVLRDVGYAESTISRVADLNLKKSFPADPESRVLEDALCLVFLQFQFADLASKTEDEKIINALRKSWQKMTSKAHEYALQLEYGVRERALLHRALSDAGEH